MKRIKILLLGITGDLARIKVLPALSEFATLHQKDFEVHLIGYSRSKADEKEVENILNQNIKHDKHKIKTIEYIQDSYNNIDRFNQIIDGTSKQDKLIIYLAVPPVVFIPFLKSACPLDPSNLHIVIEKPFGRSIEEARSLIDTATSCTLTKQVHFFDHYMFKSSSILPVECVFELAKLNQKIIKSIEIRAVEKIGVKGRAGYYDTIGATKDMWQHLFSLTNLLANYSGKKLSWTKFEVNNYQTGQYQTYLNDLKLKSSTTESYFGLEGKIGDILVKAESGKKLGTKETSIQVTYEDGSSIKWNIDKQKFLAIYNSDGQLINSTSLSQQNLLNDHTNLFNYILQENPSRFVTNEQVICSWLTFNKIKNFKTSLKKYKDGIYPVKWLD